MPDAVKGGLFVGTAVAIGILVGLLAPSLVGAERQTGERSRAHTPPPSMPSVIGKPLDEAEAALTRRGIAYVTDAPDLVEMLVPAALEVCDSEPGPGKGVRGSARLRAELVGTCNT